MCFIEAISLSRTVWPQCTLAADRQTDKPPTIPTHGWQANESVLSEACPSLCLSVDSVCLSAEVVHCGQTVRDRLMASRKHIWEVDFGLYESAHKFDLG